MSNTTSKIGDIMINSGQREEEGSRNATASSYLLVLYNLDEPSDKLTRRSCKGQGSGLVVWYRSASAPSPRQASNIPTCAVKYGKPGRKALNSCTNGGDFPRLFQCRVSDMQSEWWRLCTGIWMVRFMRLCFFPIIESIKCCRINGGSADKMVA